MKERYRVFRRGWGTYYCLDSTTGKQTSLETKDASQAKRLVHAKNEAHLLPAMNMQMARAYLQASDAEVSKRTWRFVMEEVLKTKKGSTHYRWTSAIKDLNFDAIRELVLLETRAEHLLAVLQAGTVSTNVYLRRIHNFALDMNRLPWAVIPKKQWPKVRYAAKRAITFEEHESIIAREKNPERKAFYELCWHLGASQGDLASLTAEDIDWRTQSISFFRAKTETPAQVHFGDAVKAILLELPTRGPLFPYLSTVRASDRATEFKQRCATVQIEGVTLHSYRYAWAERAKKSGYPERFAQQALGHNSKAVHRYYARNALVKIPALEDYEKEQKERAIVKVDFDANGNGAAKEFDESVKTDSKAASP